VEDVQGAWFWWCEGLRKRWGFESVVKWLLIMGCNRSSKSNYAAKRATQLMAEREDQMVYAFHATGMRSVKEQQALFWHYMPPEWRKQRADVDVYMKYKGHTGFAGQKFTNPMNSTGVFHAYTQNKTDILEGISVNLAVPDELCPPDWIHTLTLRMADRSGQGILTFTPVLGYTPTVKEFLDGGTVVRFVPGFMLPRDGGEPAPHLHEEAVQRVHSHIQQIIGQGRGVQIAAIRQVAHRLGRLAHVGHRMRHPPFHLRQGQKVWVTERRHQQLLGNIELTHPRVCGLCFCQGGFAGGQESLILVHG
jgi:phage terminase large subunit-like protein